MDWTSALDLVPLLFAKQSCFQQPHGYANKTHGMNGMKSAAEQSRGLQCHLPWSQAHPKQDMSCNAAEVEPRSQWEETCHYSSTLPFQTKHWLMRNKITYPWALCVLVLGSSAFVQGAQEQIFGLSSRLSQPFPTGHNETAQSICTKNNKGKHWPLDKLSFKEPLCLLV